MTELNALLIDNPLRLPVDWDLNKGMVNFQLDRDSSFLLWIEVSFASCNRCHKGWKRRFLDAVRLTWGHSFQLAYTHHMRWIKWCLAFRKEACLSVHTLWLECTKRDRIPIQYFRDLGVVLRWELLHSITKIQSTFFFRSLPDAFFIKALLYVQG